MNRRPSRLWYALAGLFFLTGSIVAQTVAPPPPRVIFSTYLGDNGFDEGFSVATDANGNVYVAGLTTSVSFPGSVAPLAGSDGIYVSKFSPTGQLLYTTRIGGSGINEAYAIAVDKGGNAYITGETGSADFPIINGFQTNFGGGFSDAFIAKLDPSGNQVYSSFLGGNSSGNEFGRGIAVDSSGNAYIVGTTSAQDFPVRNAFQGNYGGGSSDAFVAKINTNSVGAGSLLYSTYLGSFGFDSGNAIAVDGYGNAYVAGVADCCFPTTPNAIQPFLGNSNAHVFVSKLGPDGSLLYSTLLGGSSRDAGRGIAVDQLGNIYVTGETASSDFPVTAQAFQVANRGPSNGFISKIDHGLQGSAALVYSSFLGGSNADTGASIAVDPSGRVYVTGRATSADFPVQSAIQSSNAGGDDAFVVQLDPTVSNNPGLLFGSYLGGGSNDEGLSIAVAPGGRVAITGFTDANFPVSHAFQSAPGGSRDAFVTYLTWDTAPPILLVPSDTVLNATSPAGAAFNFTVTATDLMDPHPVAQCAPAPGSTFAIGTTLDTCTATDASGNVATASFHVTVKGAAQQIADLKAYVASLNLGPGLTNSLESKLNAAAQDPLPGSCSDLGNFINQVNAQTGKAISSQVATQLVATAKRIKSVLGCS